jgi:uridine kinase
MLGDKLIIEKDHKDAAEKLADILLPEISRSDSRYVITLAGETGSGKSGIAHELAGILIGRGIETILVQQDDYFVIPPKTNHKKRREDMSVVGVSEVRLSLLQEHLRCFKDPEAVEITKPLVMFEEDKITEETVDCRSAKALIIEGTYVSLLENVDKKIFLEKTYEDTLAARMLRKRDKIDELDRKILAIEHDIISRHKDLADIVINKDYSIVTNK